MFDLSGLGVTRLVVRHCIKLLQDTLVHCQQLQLESMLVKDNFFRNSHLGLLSM